MSFEGGSNPPPGVAPLNLGNADNIATIFDACFDDELDSSSYQLRELLYHSDLTEFFRSLKMNKSKIAYGCPTRISDVNLLPLTTRQFNSSPHRDMLIFCAKGNFVSARGIFTCFVCVYPEELYVTYRKMIEKQVGLIALATENHEIAGWTDRLFTRSTNELAQNAIHHFYVGSDRQILAVLMVEKISSRS
jgi:hypothetical protein